MPISIIHMQNPHNVLMVGGQLGKIHSSCCNWRQRNKGGKLSGEGATHQADKFIERDGAAAIHIVLGHHQVHVFVRQPQGRVQRLRAAINAAQQLTQLAAVDAATSECANDFVVNE